MQYEENTSNLRIFMTFIGGLAIGYGAALLLAPRPGSETRRILTDYAQTTGDRLSSMAKGAVESARRTGETAREQAGELTEEARKQARGVTGGSSPMHQ